MSWAALPPLTAGVAKGSVAPVVTLGATAGMKGKKPFLVLVVRATRDAGLSWLRAGQRVAVELGGGEHAGQIRVVPGSTHLVASTGGRMPPGQTKPVIVKLAPLPGVAFVPQRPCAVEHEARDGSLQIRLPDWARPGTTPTAAEPAPAKKAPYATAGTTGRDPFAHMRRPVGPVPT